MPRIVRHCSACNAPETDTSRHGQIERRPLCVNCYAPAIAAYKAQKRAEGLAWWAARGFQPGDTVKFRIATLYGPAICTGTAKVGDLGAYVTSDRYPRRKICPTSCVYG